MIGLKKKMHLVVSIEKNGVDQYGLLTKYLKKAIIFHEVNILYFHFTLWFQFMFQSTFQSMFHASQNHIIHLFNVIIIIHVRELQKIKEDITNAVKL